jgi:phytanoyl-CoA dioxygenase PhyH
MFATLEAKAPHVVSDATDFEKNGVIGPVRLFTPAQCRLFSSHARQATRSSLRYSKDRLNDRFLYDLATRPALLSLVTSCLGANVIFWGAELIERKPGQSHPWHTDIESSSPDGGFASVWIGLENTSRDSALQVITRSHLLGKTVQQVRHEKDVPRDVASSDQVLAWAREGRVRTASNKRWRGAHFRWAVVARLTQFSSKRLATGLAVTVCRFAYADTAPQSAALRMAISISGIAAPRFPRCGKMQC